MIGLMEEDNMQKLNDLNLLDKAIVEKVEANKNIKKSVCEKYDNKKTH